jgi:hypothetical protein
MLAPAVTLNAVWRVVSFGCMSNLRSSSRGKAATPEPAPGRKLNSLNDRGGRLAGHRGRARRPTPLAFYRGGNRCSWLARTAGELGSSHPIRTRSRPAIPPATTETTNAIAAYKTLRLSLTKSKLASVINRASRFRILTASPE